jgi:hypothetical protein
MKRPARWRVCAEMDSIAFGCGYPPNRRITIYYQSEKVAKVRIDEMMKTPNIEKTFIVRAEKFRKEYLAAKSMFARQEALQNYKDDMEKLFPMYKKEIDAVIMHEICLQDRSVEYL